MCHVTAMSWILHVHGFVGLLQTDDCTWSCMLPLSLRCLTSQWVQLVATNKLQKGDVIPAAQLAGVLGAKQTPSLIPLCHPLPLTKVTCLR